MKKNKYTFKGQEVKEVVATQKGYHKTKGSAKVCAIKLNNGKKIWVYREDLKKYNK